MPIFQVTFTKEFDIFLRAASREEAEAAVETTIEDHELDSDWGTGDWDSFVSKKPCDVAADHGVSNGRVVNIEDAD